MLERPDISDAALNACLGRDYGIEVAELVFLPVGNDVDAAAFRVTTRAGEVFYLKLRRGGFNAASVAVPRLLAANGMRAIIPPLPGLSGQLSAELQGFTLALYPFVEGRNAFQAELSDRQWREFGAALRQLHETALPASTVVPSESYDGGFRERSRAILEFAENGPFPDPAAANFAEFVCAQGPVIELLIERAEAFAGELRRRQPPLVLCHADIHAANILIDSTGALYLVDWDTLVFAPPERDLMFIGAGVGGAWNRPHEEALFYSGYGPYEVDHEAIGYYRCERIIEDVVAYAGQLLATPAGGRDRERGLAKFRTGFQPGNPVDMALRTLAAV